MRDWPENLVAQDRHLFEQYRTYDWPAGQIDNYQNLIASAQGDLFHSIHVLEESFGVPMYYKSRRRLKFLSRGVRARLQIERSIAGEWLWITDQWSKNYFHWLCDTLPRLEVALSAYQEFQDGARLLLPPQIMAWEVAKATLALYPGLDIQSYSKRGGSARIEKLVVPRKTSLSGNYNEPLIRRVATRLTDGLPYRDGPAGMRNNVYISRAQVGIRRVLNENEMTPVLTAAGVTSHLFENLSFAQQVTTMRGADILVAPHGAGLSNMLFMKPGSLIVEIFAAGAPINPCYYALANALGHRYRYVLGMPEFEGQRFQVGNIIVPLDALERALIYTDR